jgi:hypothetical protein
MRGRVLVGVFATLIIAAAAFAQEGGTGAGRIEIGAFPGGGMFFTQSSNGNAPEFGNYALGASFTYNMNRYLGFEGEGGGTIGMHQTFTVGSTTFTNQRSPSTLTYNGNVVVNPVGSDRPLVPYATVGIGGLTMSPKGEAVNLGITDYETYLTGNLGGGLKWFSTRHFGLRGDYRFFMVKNKDTAPLFFGTETRYGHRIQAGLIFTY